MPKKAAIPAAPPTVCWIYTGRRPAKGKGVVHGYEDETGRSRYFKKPVTPSRIIGGIYEIEADDTTAKISRDPRSFKGKVEGRDTDILEWRIEDETAATTNEALNRQNRMAGGDSAFLDMTVRDLQRQVTFLPAFRRRVLVAHIIELLYGHAL